MLKSVRYFPGNINLYELDEITIFHEMELYSSVDMLRELSNDKEGEIRKYQSLTQVLCEIAAKPEIMENGIVCVWSENRYSYFFDIRENYYGKAGAEIQSQYEGYTEDYIEFLAEGGLPDRVPSLDVALSTQDIDILIELNKEYAKKVGGPKGDYFKKRVVYLEKLLTTIGFEEHEMAEESLLIKEAEKPASDKQ